MNRDELDDLVYFDHVMVAVNDPQLLCLELAEKWGLHVHSDVGNFADGVSNLIVPLAPPQYLEILYVRDEEAFAGTDDEAIVETLRRGGGLVGVVLRTQNLAAISEMLGQPVTSGAALTGSTSPTWRL